MEVTPIRISVLGKRASSNWRDELVGNIKSWFSKLDSDKSPMFYLPVHPSQVSFFPDGMDRYIEPVFAQERLMASRSDIVLYVNDGAWDEQGNKSRHLKKMFDLAPVVLTWTPPEVSEELPSIDDPIHSGAVNVHGDASTVASLLAFIAMANIV